MEQSSMEGCPVVSAWQGLASCTWLLRGHRENCTLWNTTLAVVVEGCEKFLFLTCFERFITRARRKRRCTSCSGRGCHSGAMAPRARAVGHASIADEVRKAWKHRELCGGLTSWTEVVRQNACEWIDDRAPACRSRWREGRLPGTMAGDPVPSC